MRVLFLPGAAGAASFWRPVAALLPAGWERVLLSWPGLGEEPPDPGVRGFEDLVGLVERELAAGPCALVAQSMGGVVAIRVAARHPGRVARLVLVATSGGLDVARLRAADWRAQYRRAYPAAAAWATGEWPDHGAELAAIAAPTLLIWGDRDPLSPPAVGRRLARLLPDSALRVIAGGTHDLAFERPAEVAELIAAHLGAGGALRAGAR